MNILFSAGYLYRYPFANNNIEILLADTLTTQGHTCHVYGFSTDLCGEKRLPTGTTLARHNPYRMFEDALCKLERFVEADTTGSDRITLAKRFALSHPFSAALIILSRKDVFYRNIKQQYAKEIKRYIAKHSIDAIICFAYPFPFVSAITESDLNIPLLYYQFDPYGLHETIGLATQAENIAHEVAAMQRANYTITTHALYAQYQQHPAYQAHLSHCVPMDFPVFCEKEQTDCAPAFQFDTSNLNLLFCGTLDDGFRSPQYLLDACAPLFAQMPELKLYFLGSITSETLTRYAMQYPNNIFLHPVVESDVASKTIAQADMLINIGNAISNMVPSKIFDYFATGKPIINLQKIEHCPARSYFETYPMQFTLLESDASPASAQTQALVAFLQAHRGKQLDFAEVAPLYETATPQFVANELHRMIKELQT